MSRPEPGPPVMNLRGEGPSTPGVMGIGRLEENADSRSMSLIEDVRRPPGGAGPRVTQSRQHEATNSERWGTQLGRSLVARRHGVVTLGPSSGSQRGTVGDDLYWSGRFESHWEIGKFSPCPTGGQVVVQSGGTKARSVLAIGYLTDNRDYPRSVMPGALCCWVCISHRRWT